MPLVPDTLPPDIDALRRLVLEQQQHLDVQSRALAEREQTLSDVECELALNRELLGERDKEIARLQERLALLLSKRYQHSSEKLDGIQGKLFDESEFQQEIAELEQQLADAIERKKATSSRNTPPKAPTPPPVRKPLPGHLGRVDIEVSVSDEDLQMMGDEWELIGFEISEQLAVHDREYYVKRYKRAKWVRKHREVDSESVPGEHDIRVAPPAPVMLPKSMVDATFLAKIVTGKFIDGLSFNRELKVLEREGIEIGYSTLCSYPIQLHQRLQPLEALFYEQAALAHRWHLDETTLQVLQEPGREARTKSYLWAMRAELDTGTLVLFHYDERRNYEALENWLAPSLVQFDGVIVSDEHKPYARLANEYDGIAARGGCWSHCRRKYVDAVKGRRVGSDAHRVLKYIAKLYQLEDRTSGLQGEALVSARQKLILPWASKFKSVVDELAPQYADQSLMKTAITYTRNNWGSLMAFVDHADLVIDNNPVENAIRPFTVGRRNWLYSGSPRGAAASAFLYSLVESAKANGWEPKRYLTTLFERYPYARTQEQRRCLLPVLLKPPD